ncbi:hypothetical protein NrS5_03 [Nitratiruptor phage NrS-5]|uniref:hypothetical protein n=1 Tax=unclassified Nitratiruptor TaxID=2624044 RepID=UPI0019158AC8|nr:MULTISPECIES: hypothetical protein [unclassified Nitratiruptor]BCD61707.1 hypothetical protein NitYY0813_C0567 [Nitratiruptor sp. YY08-13]BCD65642.1 hypothetical protein NitYY0826_C0569 [Nitratiruptor sp. YY08-26]BCD83185.1 hypothetical protein NrS4_03 [Nitratiruptor phage NrS-4]BCD83244.1 hypothetical protein NrS5_03 [Nitratiruptor phage NrS-5]
MNGSITYESWKYYSIKFELINAKLQILAMALDDFCDFQDKRLFYIRDCIEELAEQYLEILEDFNNLKTIHPQPHN